MRRVPGKTSTDVGEEWESLAPLLRAMHREFQDISKKKPDGTVSGVKLKMVNRLLSSVKAFLKDEISAPYLDLLQDDDIPQNSDVVIVLSQALAAMDAFKHKHQGLLGW
jgi:hypothetical protein